MWFENLKFVRRLRSLVRARPVTVRIEVEKLDDGKVKLIPVFEVDGTPVPADVLKPAQTQSIDGVRVRASKKVLDALNETQGRPVVYTRRKAPEVIAGWSTRGYDLRQSGSGERVQVADAHVEVEVALDPNDGLRVKADLTDASGRVLDRPSAEDLREHNGWIEVSGSIFAVPETPPQIVPALAAAEGVELSGDDVPQTLGELRKGTRKVSVTENAAAEKALVFSEETTKGARIDGNDTVVSVEPVLVFGTGASTHQETTQDVRDFAGEGTRKYKRVPRGWIPAGSKGRDARRVEDELAGQIGREKVFRGAAIPDLLKQVTQLAQSTPWNFYVSDRVRKAHHLLETESRASFRLGVVSVGAGSLLALDPLYNHDRFQFTHAEVAGAASRQEDWLRRDNTWVRIDKAKFDAVTREAARQGLETSEGGFRFPAMRREEVLGGFRSLGKIEEDDSYKAFLRKLLDFRDIEETSLPSGLSPGITFRPYQQAGYNWLIFLQKFGLNGILADDMGLGKTLQTLAAIQYAKENDPPAGWFPSLVICPVSVIQNWRMEAARFFPGLNVVAYAGPGRDAEYHRARLWAADLMITSFQTAVNDSHVLSQVPWRYIVIDEAHNVKNPQTQRAASVRSLPSRHKVALTGTPVQNTPVELWALFDLLMPGYLGSQPGFKKEYASLLQQNDGKAFGKAAQALRQKTGPFVMRRLKKDVAADLPDKLIIDRTPELSPRQVRLYKAITESEQSRALRSKIDKDADWARSSIQILALLAKLRNICNHPAIEDKGETDVDSSGKLDHLSELIEEIVEGDHRALLFSQSTAMLDIIQRHMAAWKVGWLRLDGSTPPAKRQPLVDQFNTDHSLRCFLISTKAGGTGLNLTGADTVIMYDHDWNPANDHQAIDRAYRIGQTRNVTVYRLASKGTLEEKILSLQARKAAVADALISPDSDGIKHLTREQLLGLFDYTG